MFDEIKTCPAANGFIEAMIPGEMLIELLLKVKL
jgi:hypothetical protein